MNNFYHRLSKIADIKGFKSVNKLAITGLNYASSEKLNRLKKENNNPSFEIIVDISNKFEDIDLNWLITGKGEPISKNQMSIEQASEIYNQANEPSESYIIDNKLILAHKKTIEVLESVVTDLRNDKELLHQIIKNCFTNK